MASRAVKVAVSLPLEEYRLIENARKDLHMSRSSVISEAIRRLFADRHRREKIEAYVEGYRRHPETALDVQLHAKVASEVLAGEEWSK